MRTEADRLSAAAAEPDPVIRRAGGMAAIVGALMGMVGNLLHPSTAGHDRAGVATIIAESAAWTPLHLTIVVGLILMLFGLTALCRSMTTGPSGGFAVLAQVAAVAGIAVGVILVTLDGLAAKHLATAWAAAPPEEQTIALWVLTAEEIFNFALASLFNILFAGVTYLLLGMAVLLGGVFPRYLGWFPIVSGIGSIVAGLIQAYTGASTGITAVLTIVFPTIITLWTAYMGVLLLRLRS